MNGNIRHSTKDDAFPEARASFTVKYIDASGFESMLTLRADSGVELLEKASTAINYLVEHGASPWISYRNNSRFTETKADENTNGDVKTNGKDSPGWCSIHHTQMKQRNKDGKVWFSHKTSEGWCNGKKTTHE